MLPLPKAKSLSFEIDSFAKNCLLKGLDDIGWTLQFEEKIQSYERQARESKTMAIHWQLIFLLQIFQNYSATNSRFLWPPFNIYLDN